MESVARQRASVCQAFVTPKAVIGAPGAHHGSGGSFHLHSASTYPNSFRASTHKCGISQKTSGLLHKNFEASSSKAGSAICLRSTGVRPMSEYCAIRGSRTESVCWGEARKRLCY